MSDLYRVWRKKLKGADCSPQDFFPTMGWPNSFENPQPGMYRSRLAKGGLLKPIRIWLVDDDGKPTHTWKEELHLCCTIDGKPERTEVLVDRWMFCDAVSKDDFRHYEANGVWPGEVPTARSNSDNLTIQDEIADAVETALAWLKSNKVADKTTADMCANYRTRLLDLSKKANAQREAEKRPHDEAAKAVQAKYKPVIELAEDAAGQLRGALTAWMVAEESRQRAEAEVKRKAAEEEARKAWVAEQDERQRIIDASPTLPPETELPKFSAEPPIVATEPVKVQAGGQRGRKAGLREVTRYVVTDHNAALAFFANADAIKELVQKLAEQASKAGAAVPGVQKVTEKVAA